MGIFDMHFRDIMPMNSFGRMLLDKTVKPIIRGLIEAAGRSVQPIYDKKAKEGWANPEIEFMHKWFNELLEKEEAEYTKQKNFPNPDYTMMQNVRNVACVVLDEDSHWLMRFFFMMEMAYRDEQDFMFEMHGVTRGFWTYNLKKLTENDKRWRGYKWQSTDESIKE